MYTYYVHISLIGGKNVKASVVEMRTKMREVLRALDRNETVTLLYHGKEKATLVPTQNKKRKSAREHAAFGMWKDDPRTRDVPGYVRKIRESRNAL